MKKYPTPQDLPIIEVDRDADVFLAGKDTVADVKFSDMTFYIAVTGADGKDVVLKMTHGAIQEMAGKLGLVAAEVERTFIANQVEYGRELARGEGWSL